ncbi:MAG: hypothetical protein L3J92_05925 [Thermoplasmata archaeon]|jgi:tRNA pseudouridine(38-40) synthase|nr:hypothetical protein [Thermoplasmata archaeon]
MLRPDAAHRVLASSLEVASRTDRGVSARANALTVESTFEGPNLLRWLNGIAPDLWFTDATIVPDGFRTRGAVRRVYRYYESNQGRDIERTRAAAQLFIGTVDVRSLARGLTSTSPVLRNVEALELTPRPDGWTIEVRAPAFVWGMVRKIVASLREVDAGRLSLPRLSECLRGERRLTLPMAEPEPLLLWEVQYLQRWSFHWRGPNRRQSEGARERRALIRAQADLYDDRAVDRD